MKQNRVRVGTEPSEIPSNVCNPEDQSFIHRIYGLISPLFRRKRFNRFRTAISPTRKDAILDVGGLPEQWTEHKDVGAKIQILNVHEIPESTDPRISLVIGDGCNLQYEDLEFDIIFSNSVIEHVSTRENQERFAAEMRRTGKMLWIQTPAKEFFIEPHFITPFVHWLPKSWQRILLPYCSLWAWLKRPSLEEVDKAIAEIRLLTFAEMVELFPDCEILRERFLLIFTKSYIACRK